MKVVKLNKRPAATPAKSTQASEVVTLPKQRSAPRSALQDYSILLYGAKKIGKTSLASMFPQAFFLLFEPGGKALAIYERPVRSWKEFKAYVALLKRDTTFKNVVIDTADIAYDLCLRHVCEKLVISHPSEEEWGKGWKAVSEEFNTTINELLHTGKGVIFISHAREIEIKKRDGQAFNKTSSTLSGQAKETLEGIVDVWAFYTYEGTERVLFIQGDDYIDAGHRIEDRFLWSDGTPIRVIPMGDSKTTAYENFVAAFENRMTKSSKQPTNKPTIQLRRTK